MVTVIALIIIMEYYYMPVTVSYTSRALAHLMLTVTPESNYYYPHLLDEETED